jgi:hypothetical protein
VQHIIGNNRGNVDAYNRAAYASKGDILVQVHDDVTPPKSWDREIVQRIRDPQRPALLLVSDGQPAEVNKKPWLPTVAIVTRKYAERVGGLWYPGYVSISCDDDLGQKAMKDGVVIEAKDLVFQHDWQGKDRDETQKRSYSEENWEQGMTLLEQRNAAGFPDAPELWGKGWQG